MSPFPEDLLADIKLLETVDVGWARERERVSLSEGWKVAGFPSARRWAVGSPH